MDGIRSSLLAFTPEGAIGAVYYSPDEQYLDLRGTRPSVDSAVYRLQVGE